MHVRSSGCSSFTSPPRSLLALMALLLVALAAAPARAQSDVDMVTTRDGAVLRGHISEIRPNTSITIVLLTGESRVIPWADFAGGSGPSFPGSPGSPPPPPPPSDMPPPPLGAPAPGYDLSNGDQLLQPGAGRVPLRIESATGKRLAVGVPVGTSVVNGYGYTVTANRRLCDAPCTLYVPPGTFTFNAATPDLAYDQEVEVAPRGSALRMRTPSRGRALGGLWMLTGGLSIAVVGLTVMILGSIDTNVGTSHSSHDPTPYYAGGGALIGVGGGMFVGGIYLLATNRRGIESRHDF
jgi:hypothetical protein